MSHSGGDGKSPGKPPPKAPPKGAGKAAEKGSDNVLPFRRSSDSQANDEPARQRIRSALDQSLMVEAAAGTGKTTELVRRLVSVLAEGRAEVDEIVAVTFTRKAAGELKLRLRERLDHALNETQETGSEAKSGHAEEDNRARRRHLERAISRLEGARVGTIHSFCAEILRSRPVEAGVDPGFVEVADDEGPRLFAQAFDPWVQEQLDEMRPGLRRALSRLALSSGFFGGTPLERLADAGWRLAEWRDYPAPWRREPFDRESLIDELMECIEQLADWSQRCANPRDELRRSLEPVVLLATWVERGEAVADRDYDALEARLLELLRFLKRPFNRRKGRGKFAEALPREQVVKAREALINALQGFGDAADADLAALLRDELAGATERYEALKQSLAKLDFSDLLIRTRDLLRRDPEVRRHLQRSCRYLFVDEFQDTDPVQAEILLLLAADNPDESDWRKASPEPGKLFLVGDPKQSIYRFRRADILLYQEIKELLVAKGVQLVHLNRSFRSTPPIQRFVNAAFEARMDGNAEHGRPAYVPLAEARPSDETQPAIIALPVPRPYGWRGIAKSAIDQSLPDATAAFVHWLLEESGYRVEVEDSLGVRQSVPIQASHVCLLFRRFLSWGKDTTRGYTNGLELRGVPHLLIGARSFHRKEEVETLRAALIAIEWPDDELEIYATLRGSLFALPDDLLLRFKTVTGGFHPFRWRRLGDDLAADLALVGQALDLLADLHRRRNKRAIVETVQGLLAATRAHAGFALRPAGQQVLANVERICELARSYELSGGRSFRGFVEELTREAEKPASGQAPVVEDGAEGVRLMTVHTAKGLEFPVVILADMSARLAPVQPDRTVDAKVGLAASRVLGCTPYELLDRAELETRRDQAEGDRIAYVAATRARDLLVVPVVGDRKVDGWLEPLNDALYPGSKSRRDFRPAPGCPEFSDRSVLERPVEHDGGDETSVRPGLHWFEAHDYGVAWWDPKLVDVPVEQNFGLRQEEILTADRRETVALGNKRRYLEWEHEQKKIRERGSAESFRIAAVTELDEEPPPSRFRDSSDGSSPAGDGEERVETVEIERDFARPSGKAFGTLVHNLLQQVDLGADRVAIDRLATLLRRELGAKEAEAVAASIAVERTLAHPLLRQAKNSERYQRETPFVFEIGDGRTLEGTLDLAFLEHGVWTVVDFKTDFDLAAMSEKHRRQVRWYCYALESLTGAPARGVIFGV